jgi:glutamate racemase
MIEISHSSPQPPGEMGGVGLFDSGVGGLSVWQAVRQALPAHNLTYFADQKYCPYGPRPREEIRALSARITALFIARRCAVIVVACNTASAAALYYLRDAFPDIRFVGMEPAVKPAASRTRSGKIAVLATQGTLEGDLFTHTRDSIARGIQVTTVYPQDWVVRVERGEQDSEATLQSVRRVIEPLLEDGVDEIALGCTHYPFLAPVIVRVAAGRASVLDPSEAVARETVRHVRELDVPPSSSPTRVFYTSGDPDAFARVMEKLLEIRGQRVKHADPPLHHD